MANNRAVGGRQSGGGRLTVFGAKMREIRKAKGLLLMHMADAAKVSPGFLSLVETGKRPIPKTLVPAIVAGLDLNKALADQLLEAAALSAKDFRIALRDDAPTLDRQVAHALETGFAKLSSEDKAALLGMLERD